MRRCAWAVLGILLAAGARADGEAELSAKMQKTVIPRVEFRQASIEDVVAFLRQASRDYDPAEDPAQRKEINLVLNLRQGTGPDAGAMSVIPITMKARDIALREALDIVTQVAGLKYRIEGNVVLIVPLDAPDGPIVHRSYTVIPSVGEKVQRVQDEMAP